MIADLDETIRQLLIDELPIKNGEIDIDFHQPTRAWSARVSKPTVNLYLYDVRENPHLRANQWEQVVRQGGRIGKDNGDIVLKRTPVRLDCFYMLTTWATEPEDEHLLLTRVLLTLFRFPVVPEARLAARLQNPAFDITMRLASHDILTNPAELWSSLDNEIRPSVSYVATLALDPWEEVATPAVRVLSMTAGQEPRPQELRTRRLQANQQAHTSQRDWRHRAQQRRRHGAWRPGS